MFSWIGAAFVFASYMLTTASLYQDLKYEPREDLRSVTLGILLGLYLITYFSMIYATYKVTVSDPTDPTVAYHRHKRQVSHATEKTDEQLMKTAELFCSICETQVINNTKHCSICNRCCYEFDHHC